MTDTNYIRVSYSILSKVEQGYIDEAIAMIEGRHLPATDKQEIGKKYHQYIEKYIKQTNELPYILGGGSATGETEKKIEQKLIIPNWTIELVGVLDYVDKEEIQDWKIGSTESMYYTRSMQHCIYKLLYPQAKKFIYRCYNPYENTCESSIIFLNESHLLKAHEWVTHYAMELANNLIYQANDSITIANDKMRFIYNKEK